VHRVTIYSNKITVITCPPCFQPIDEPSFVDLDGDLNTRRFGVNVLFEVLAVLGLVALIIHLVDVKVVDLAEQEVLVVAMLPYGLLSGTVEVLQSLNVLVKDVGYLVGHVIDDPLSVGLLNGEPHSVIKLLLVQLFQF
jgi:hypothetical protein